jgi:hypothetical protein
MSHDDQRNTLIVELASRTSQANLQGFNDFELAGMGAVLILLRAAKLCDDNQLKAMTADDQRNTLIVNIGSRTNAPMLQGLNNLDLVLLALGQGN